jgi:hypothetical protein
MLVFLPERLATAVAWSNVGLSGLSRQRILIWEGEFPVVSKSFLVILFLVTAAWLSGCSAIAPERKSPSTGSRILEEDVTNDHSAQPRAGDETSPGVDQSQPSAEGVPPEVQPEHRSPRRIKWKDRKGSLKGWELPSEGTGGREP